MYRLSWEGHLGGAGVLLEWLPRCQPLPLTKSLGPNTQEGPYGNQTPRVASWPLDRQPPRLHSGWGHRPTGLASLDTTDCQSWVGWPCQ